MGNRKVIHERCSIIIEKYKGENRQRIHSFYFDMPVIKVKHRDTKDPAFFISKADDASGEFDFLVASCKEKKPKTMAGFNTLDNAQDYMDYRERF